MRSILLAVAVLAPLLTAKVLPLPHTDEAVAKREIPEACPAPKEAFHCPDSHGIIFTDAKGYSYEIECDTDHGGNSIGTGQACEDLDTCISKCTETTGCAYASFAKGICTLKSSDSAHSDSGSPSKGTACAHQIGQPGSSSAVPCKPSGSAGSPGGDASSRGYGQGGQPYSETFSTKTRSPTGAPSESTSATKTWSSWADTCTSTNPKETYTAGDIPDCKRCEGQPGNDKYCGFDINTNYYEHTPITCNVVTYEFDLTEATIAPDGVERHAMVVNGQVPGPTIKASWGDTVVVKINNKMTTNGTSIHWHGVRQWNNNGNDGVASITQCPVPPGESMTYTWIAQNYGTSWYHAHHSLQAWEGIFGPIEIDGPKSAEYDEELGTFVLMDWSHSTADELYALVQDRFDSANVTSSPFVMDNGLINGMNVWNGPDGNSPPIGARFEASTKLKPGKKYLMRFINGAIQSTYKVYIDQHELTVISNDFVPIKPYKTNVLNISGGQRYEVIVEATQHGGSFWLRADNQDRCGVTVQAKDIKAIVHYEGDDSTPTSTAYTSPDECIDEPMASLVPVLSLNAGKADITANGVMDVIIEGNDAQVFKWYLSGTTFKSEWGDPILLDIQRNEVISDYAGNLQIETPVRGQWVYVIIESIVGLPHPLHLHGHDFFVLDAGTGSYDGRGFNLHNPTRRDTALMPAAGWIAVAFITDNPGVWPLHCHIGWHSAMGFSLSFVELQDEIKTVGALDNGCALEDTCNKWNAWAFANNRTVTTDSGI